MRKIHMCLLLALLALLLCGTALACPYEDCDGNSYTYEYVDQSYHRLVCVTCGRGTLGAHTNKDATCLEGVTCLLCGHVFTDPLGHDLHYVSDGNALCTSDGTKTLRCLRTEIGRAHV